MLQTVISQLKRFHRLAALAMLLFPTLLAGQTLLSGDYTNGLKLAFDSRRNIVIGYYENQTGMQEKTGRAIFSCIFYLQGTLTNHQFVVNTYYPTN